MAEIEIEIVREGSAREREFRVLASRPETADQGTYIRIGAFRDGHVRVVGMRRGATVYRRDVAGSSRWETQTTNQIGTLGASRDLPPTDEQINAAVAAARTAVAHRA